MRTDTERNARRDETSRDETRRDESPLPPASGGLPSRSNGTNPRAVAARASQQTAATSKARRWRVQQRDLAYFRGALSEAERDRHNAEDTPVEEIPGWAEHQTSLGDDSRPWESEPAGVSS